MYTTNSIKKLRYVTAQVGLSKATLYKMIRENKFPAPKKLGVRSVGWLESDIQEWIDSRISTKA
jgi:prophage regulatory protein